MSDNADVKILEIRDTMTFIQAMAIVITPQTDSESYLWRSAGYSGRDRYVLFGYLKSSKMSYDPYNWDNGRTMGVAHDWLIKNWDSVTSGDVIDVEYILDEKDEKSISCRLETY